MLRVYAPPTAFVECDLVLDRDPVAAFACVSLPAVPRRGEWLCLTGHAGGAEVPYEVVDVTYHVRTATAGPRGASGDLLGVTLTLRPPAGG